MIAGARLLLFAKTPLPGTVKTRLAAALPEPATTQFYIELLNYTVSQAVQAALCPIELWVSPQTQHPLFQYYQQQWDIPLYLQQGNDLGQRMSHALQSALTRASVAVIIGSDCPSLTALDIQMAIHMLIHDTAPVVFVPAEDGGYVLLGVQQVIPALFNDMPWGSSQIMALSRLRLGALSIPWRELETRWDVDTAADWQRLQQQAFWQRRPRLFF